MKGVEVAAAVAALVWTFYFPSLILAQQSPGTGFFSYFHARRSAVRSPSSFLPLPAAIFHYSQNLEALGSCSCHLFVP
jgi:hypothetical protein